MLVITRRTRDIFILGDFLVMKVADIRGKHVTIGIAFPAGTRIYRSNIHKMASLLKKDNLSHANTEAIKIRKKLTKESLSTELITLRLGERAIVDDNIVIQIVDIHGKQTRIGIETQAKIDVHHWEAYKETVVENRDLIETAITEIDKTISEFSISGTNPKSHMKYSPAVLDITVSHDISPDNLGKLLTALNRLHVNLSGQPLTIESIKIGVPDSIYDFEEVAETKA